MLNFFNNLTRNLLLINALSIISTAHSSVNSMVFYEGGNEDINTRENFQLDNVVKCKKKAQKR